MFFEDAPDLSLLSKMAFLRIHYELTYPMVFFWRKEIID
jgi:hypothetical protein